jgi:outer membrane biosynthesis protein TonB
MSEIESRRFGDDRATQIRVKVADSFERAVRWFRRVTFIEPPRRPGKPSPKDARGTAPRAPAPSRERFQKLELARKQLADEVSRREAELERMHVTITSGGTARAVADGGRERLTEVMESARQLREKIQEKRLQLVRLERRIARERQLLGLHGGAGDARTSEVPAPSRVVTRAPRESAQRAPLDKRAIKAALAKTRFSDRAERALVEGIAEGLVSDNVEMRQRAVTRIAGRPQPSIALLILAVEDPDNRVRLAALSGLNGQKANPVVDLFRRFLRNKSSALRLAALRGLASIDGRLLGDDDLVAALEDSDAGVRRAATSLLGWRQDNGTLSVRVMDALTLALYDEDEAVRVAAADALGAAGNDRAVLALIRAAGDPADAVRDASLHALRAIVGEEVETLAADAPPEQRVEALKAWWRIARVRLRAGTEGESVDVGTVAQEIIDTLAATKGETPPKRVHAQPPAPAPKPATKSAPKEAAAPPAAKAEAPKATPSAKKAAPEPEKAAAPEAPAEAAGEGETVDFESMFTPSEGEDNEGGEGEGEKKEGGEGEGGGGEGGDDGDYESVL